VLGPDECKSDVVGPSPGGVAANSLDMNKLLLGAVGKSDGSAEELLRRWHQETACEWMLQNVRIK
jgi:hypothetical protein